MRLTIVAPLIFCAAFCGRLVADDYGDAPASYGLLRCDTAPNWVCLGSITSHDTHNPVTPAWTGDDDDGVVGSPLWNPVAWDNELTVRVSGQSGGWLMLWVDANDNGVWETTEHYLFSEMWVAPGADYTFRGIRLNRPQGYSLNGANKVAVRIVVQDNMGGAPYLQPTGWFFGGEVEDWLIDCTPVGFAVTTPVLRDLVESASTSAPVKCAGGTPPYTWSQVSGALPGGVTLVQSGDDFLLTGTPSAGSGTGSPLYTFGVQCVDSLSAVAQRTMTVRVLPPPTLAPFLDTFSSDLGWVLGNTWTRAMATPYTGAGGNFYGELGSEPGHDATSSSTDNMILADSIGSPFTLGQELYQTLWATSPIIDCSALVGVQLRFKRWASTQFGGYADGEDRLRVQISTNSSTWHDVWKSSQHGAGGPLVDNAWTLMMYDISAIAAGEPHVRVRFGVGPSRELTHANPGVTPIPDDFAGWCIDDVQVMSAPQDALLVSGFSLSSPLSFQNPFNMVTYPVGLPNFHHDWQATAANPGTADVEVTSIEVGITFPEQPGNTFWYVTAFHNNHLSWYDAGDWSLGAPVTVAGGASGITISGTLACRALPATMSLLVMRCELFVRGTNLSTGAMVESRAVMECVFNHNPPGLHVFDAPSGGPTQSEVGNGSSATGLRNFGSVVTAGASPWVTIICKSNGSAPFNVSAPTLTGPDASEFELYLPGTWPAQPTPGLNNVWFSVRFKPTSLGPKSAWIEFAHTAPNAMSPFTFEVKGLGVANAPIVGLMEIDPVTGLAVANGAAAGGERDFGQVDITAPPPTPREYYVVNAGTQALTLGTPTISAGPFALDLSQFNASVPPGNYTTIIVSYTPTALGMNSAWIEFTHNDAGTANPFSFEVAGHAIVNAPTIEVRVGGPTGPMIASGSPAAGVTHFGAVNVGSAANPVLVHIRNAGQLPLTLALPMLSGTHAADFALGTGGMAGTLAFGQSTTFEILFAPLAKGPKTAAATFAHNDPQTPLPFTIQIAGLGVDPAGVAFTTSPTLALARVGDDYLCTLAATGGTAPYTFSLASGGLPTGLTLSTDGNLSGKPMGTFGIFTFRVKVTDALLGEDERQFELIVQPPPGHVEKGKKVQDSGCAALQGAASWWWVWLVLAAWHRRRKVTKESRDTAAGGGVCGLPHRRGRCAQTR